MRNDARPPLRRRTSSLLAAVIVMAAGLLGARCAAAPDSTPMKWILNGPALPVLAADARANRYLAKTRPLVMQRDGDAAVPASWDAIPMRSYTSYAHIKRAFEANAVGPSVRAIMYDNEGWEFTPLEEQRDPGTYTQLAAKLVHDHHLLFVSAPAVTITKARAPGPEKRYDAYLRLNIAADSARYADVYDIQAQGSERNTARYSDFVKRAAEQARAANPKVTVLAGISTNPSGQRVTADDILHAIDASRSSVDGYWFNIPQPGPYCPNCNDFRPDIAIDVFDRLRVGAH